MNQIDAKSMKSGFFKYLISSVIGDIFPVFTVFAVLITIVLVNATILWGTCYAMCEGENFDGSIIHMPGGGFAVAGLIIACIVAFTVSVISLVVYIISMKLRIDGHRKMLDSGFKQINNYKVVYRHIAVCSVLAVNNVILLMFMFVGMVLATASF